jgi:hypothetical protein
MSDSSKKNDSTVVTTNHNSHKRKLEETSEQSLEPIQKKPRFPESSRDEVDQILQEWIKLKANEIDIKNMVIDKAKNYEQALSKYKNSDKNVSKCLKNFKSKTQFSHKNCITYLESHCKDESDMELKKRELIKEKNNLKHIQTCIKDKHNEALNVFNKYTSYDDLDKYWDFENLEKNDTEDEEDDEEDDEEEYDEDEDDEEEYEEDDDDEYDLEWNMA